MESIKLHLNKTIRIRYIVVAAIILIILSFGIGFLWGVDTTIREGVKLARGFFNVSVDYSLVNQAIYQYKNQIGGCFPPKL